MESHVNLMLTQSECTHLRALLAMCPFSKALEPQEKDVLAKIYKDLTVAYILEFGEPNG